MSRSNRVSQEDSKAALLSAGEESSPTGEEPAHLFSYQRRAFVTAFLAGLPMVGLATFLLLLTDYRGLARFAFPVLLVASWIAGSLVLHRRMVRSLQTASNMVAGLRQQDYSFRLRAGSREDPFGELGFQLNQLADLLQQQRSEAVEAVALLNKVLLEIDVAVFAFDSADQLVLVNRAGEQLLAVTSERALGRTAQELKLHELLNMNDEDTIQYAFPGKEGRWAIQHSTLRESGVPHELLLVSDLSRALRKEERVAWQRLVRVLGHELNNSLAPIKSIAGTLRVLTSHQPMPSDWNQDLQRGLEVIEGRADSLSRFMRTYTQLAKLSAPSLMTVDVRLAVARAARAEARLPVQVKEGEPLAIQADPDQLEQLLINIIRNAVDATLDPASSGSSVSITWRRHEKVVSISVLDEGPGILNDKNLFVPFFTTKPGGSGIGLVLSRQIAELHGGTLKLKNRFDRAGCEAELRLPVSQAISV